MKNNRSEVIDEVVKKIIEVISTCDSTYSEVNAALHIATRRFEESGRNFLNDCSIKEVLEDPTENE